MATYPLIDVGSVITLTQNVVYALPQKRVVMFTSTAGAAFGLSNDPAFAASVVPTLVEGHYETVAGFIRSTAADALCCFKGF